MKCSGTATRSNRPARETLNTSRNQAAVPAIPNWPRNASVRSIGIDQTPRRSSPARIATIALMLNNNRNGTSEYRNTGFISR